MTSTVYLGKNIHIDIFYVEDGLDAAIVRMP